MKITAHGKTYETVDDATYRVLLLKAMNVEYGESDGRVTEINAIEQALAIAEAAEQVGLAEPEAEDVWEVVKQEYGMECEHPACAILHKHLSTEPFADGQGHWVDVYHNYKDSRVWMTRWHEKKVVEWVILLNGKRVGNAHDTKREALAEAATKPRY